MESFLNLVFLMFFITTLPMISPTRTFPKAQSLNQSVGLTLPIYHVHHPKMQMQIAKNLAFSPLVGAENKYLMEVNLGTPMVYALLVFDTGSDMMWIQQDLFNGSAKYRIDCDAPLCSLVPNPICTEQHACHFSMTYVGGRNVAGILRLEDLYLYASEDEDVPSVTFETPFGLGSSDGFKSAGVVGMNFGPLGLLSAFEVDKFTVCFPNPVNGLQSYVRIGEDALFPAECVPISRYARHLIFHVDSLRIAGVTLSELSGEESGEDIIFDTGSELSHLSPTAMDAVVDTMRKNITEKEAHSLEYELCYVLADDSPSLNIEFSLELGDGKELQLNTANIWKQPGKKKYCLNMKRSKIDVTILGMAQMWGKNFGFHHTDFLLCYENSDCTT